MNQQLTSDVFNHRTVVASLTASGIRLKLDRLEGIAKAFAAQDVVRARIIGGKWDKAIAETEDLSNSVDFYDYYVDRILLVDATGTVRAAYPRLDAGVDLPALAFDEWGTALRNGEAAYVSNVYKRRAASHENIVAVVAPVTGSSSIAGFVLLQVPISAFSDFGQDTDVGSNGFAYIVDRKGQIVSHPKYSSTGQIIDYSNVPAVQKLLRGESGAEILYNPVERAERVSAYGLVQGYDWGVVSVEPIADAFEARDGILHQILLSTLVLCASEFFLSILVFWLVSKFKKNGASTK